MLKFGSARIRGTPGQSDRPADFAINQRAADDQASKIVATFQAQQRQQGIAFTGGDHVPERLHAGRVPRTPLVRRLAQSKRLVAKTMALFEQQKVVAFEILQMDLQKVLKAVTIRARQMEGFEEQRF